MLSFLNKNLIFSTWLVSVFYPFYSFHRSFADLVRVDTVSATNHSVGTELDVGRWRTEPFSH